MLMFVFVKDCDLYGLFTKSVFSYLEAIQLAPSRMLDHVRGSALSDGLILGLEGHQVVPVCLCVRLILWNQNHLGVFLPYTSRRQPVGVNTAVCRYMCVGLHPVCAHGLCAWRGPGV